MSLSPAAAVPGTIVPIVLTSLSISSHRADVASIACKTLAKALHALHAALCAHRSSKAEGQPISAWAAHVSSPPAALGTVIEQTHSPHTMSRVTPSDSWQRARSKTAAITAFKRPVRPVAKGSRRVTQLSGSYVYFLVLAACSRGAR